MSPSDIVSVALFLVPSKAAPGKFNVKNPQNHAQNLSVDPNGTMTWSANDQNYEQFTRNGLAIEIAPGSDQNPQAPTIVLLPK